jgi:hypothetical protein
MLKLAIVIVLITFLSSCYRSCKSLNDNMANAKMEKYECLGWQNMYNGKFQYTLESRWGGGYYVKIKDKTNTRKVKKYTKIPKYTNLSTIKEEWLFREGLDIGTLPCKDSYINQPTSKCSKFLEGISPYPFSCNESKAWEEWSKVFGACLCNKSPLQGLGYRQDDKIKKLCTPSMTQTRLDYLRTLWVKQYMIDAYPELYPEPKEHYLTTDEMKIVEKMYELE